MDGENNGNSLLKWDDLGGKPTIFGVLTVLTGVISPLIISASGPTGPTGPTLRGNEIDHSYQPLNQVMG